jgi:uncharacterized protein
LERVDAVPNIDYYVSSSGSKSYELAGWGLSLQLFRNVQSNLTEESVLASTGEKGIVSPGRIGSSAGLARVGRTGERPPTLFWGATLAALALYPLGLFAVLLVSLSLNVFLAFGLARLQISIRKPVAPATPLALAVASSTPEAGGPSPAATLAATRTQSVSATPSPTNLAPVVSTGPTPSPTPAGPTPTPHPITAYTIEGLRGRAYPGGTIRVRSVMTVTDHFTRYYIDYPSDDLTITGVMQVPSGEGPFPVVILNHGYIPRERYWAGADTASAAGYLNRHGYLTLAPDYRSWGASDNGNSFFYTGQLIDTLNLISSLPSVPGANSDRVGLWGHSMGGGITMKAITIDPRIKAAVLYAPISAFDAEVLERWGPACEPSLPYQLDDKCGGSDVLIPGVDENLFWAYANALNDPILLTQTSPIYYFGYVEAPVQIHVGTADTVTPPRWSTTIHNGLQRAEKEVEFFTYPGQGHAFKGESWVKFMARATVFFDRHLEP